MAVGLPFVYFSRECGKQMELDPDCCVKSYDHEIVILVWLMWNI